ncbi:MAG: Glu-tRNA(Gln) amidotransferase subunit GatD [Candidatus Brockarchaeota archaeon]|nr:Glu-tRNA(Gln) amidotransferase subunit GatD [Candidatus Brockarchaeota archaeon]
MPYSKRVNELLEAAGLKPGDRVLVEKPGASYEGYLIPREEVERGDPDCVVIKLDSGYNVGVRVDGGATVKKLPGSIRLEKFGHPAPFVQNPELPPVSIISTGGTISSRIDYYTGAVATLFSTEEVLQGVPELAEIVRVRSAERLFNLYSEDLSPKNWCSRSEKVVAKIVEGDSGVLVLHGTDTMHYTAAALSFMIRNLSSPVVLVGAQRSTDRGSRDTDMNLVCASILAGRGDVGEVGICMHGEMDDSYCLFIRGTKARKMHTSRRDAFRPVNDLPIAKVWPDGRVEYVNVSVRRGASKPFPEAVFEEKVAIVKSYPGAPPTLLEALIDSGYRGIVIEGTGLGHVPTEPEDKKMSWLPAVRRGVEMGVVFAVSSQCLYGRTSSQVYRNAILLSKAGAVYLEDMLPEVGYVKLGWLLGHDYDVETVKRLLVTNIAGEIGSRVRADTYLI